ncbi:MAG: 23S rRNA (uracil(1939)-C(5))-methyltransferase RlmD [Patescibacteria group bacterium]
MHIKIEKLIYEGWGLGRTPEGKPIFVKKSVPGDLIDVEIVKDKKSYFEGRIMKIIKPSSRRINSLCPHFDRCGGCDHQNIAYPNQLKFKEEIFRETMARQGIESDILPIVPGSNEELYYRNTIRFFFINENGKTNFAMHDFEDSKKMIPIEGCLLQSKTCNSILKALRETFNDCSRQSKKNNYSSSEGGKFSNNETIEQCNNVFSSLWQLRVREGKFTNEFMVEIITSSRELPLRQEIVDTLKSITGVKSIYHTIALNKSNYNWQRRLIFGSPIIYEKAGKFTFQLSPESFFQTNSLGLKTLYDKIKEFAEIKMGDRILDLYCGTGTIGIYLSTLAKNVVGVELVQSAINDANANSRINKLSNCEFICADTMSWLKQYGNSAMKQFDKIILDPPRQGLGKKIIEDLSKLYEFSGFSSLELIYTSCNPATFARDIKEFEKRDFKLKKVQPIDMFPMTHHIECVGILCRG